MTQKHKRKLAQEMYDCELTQRNESSSKEEKTRAQNRIINITKTLMTLPSGVEILMELDEMVQGLLSKE